MRRFLLDTNIWTYLVKERDKPSSYPILAANIDALKVKNAEMMLCPTVIAELYAGVNRSMWPDATRKGIESMRKNHRLYETTLAVCRAYGDIASDMKSKGMENGQNTNDIWIAAHAIAHGLIVVTHNVKHFEKIKGLDWQNWMI